MKKKDFWIAVIAVVALYVFFHFVGIGCPIRFITGVSCMGCGTTRAVHSALRLDMKSAFDYHPLFWVPLPALVLLLNKKRIPKKIFNFIICNIIALYVVVYVYRLLDPSDTIVSFEPHNGFIYKIFNLIF
ncbi:DUF2752 domain-containing protein [Butyrivibrio sp. X503]|uniref:DUF2752 domain-containing protein n=1 Tax=Butyrivibrio sp. X503 TaxID=2364878 RepID=UPI000EAA5BD4|nr:DUF2752 domain-containing protein [Butyrivibrio sp. X503]RKM55613.1 DUF2752 domain-containing protein [Butyrivibrio sp. X503]